MPVELPAFPSVIDQFPYAGDHITANSLATWQPKLGIDYIYDGLSRANLGVDRQPIVARTTLNELQEKIQNDSGSKLPDALLSLLKLDNPHLKWVIMACPQSKGDVSLVRDIVITAHNDDTALELGGELLLEEAIGTIVLKYRPNPNNNSEVELESISVAGIGEDSKGRERIVAAEYQGYGEKHVINTVISVDDSTKFQRFDRFYPLLTDVNYPVVIGGYITPAMTRALEDPHWGLTARISDDDMLRTSRMYDVDDHLFAKIDRATGSLVLGLLTDVPTMSSQHPGWLVTIPPHLDSLMLAH